MLPCVVLRVQFDDVPSLVGLQEAIQTLVRWYENRILESTLNEVAHAGRPAYLFFDEAQNLASWGPQIKALVDHHTAHVVVTGSSALRIEAGRESLAGMPHLDVAHFPERATEPEVDFILTIEEKRIPLEVKYRRRIDPHRDTLGLRSFLEKAHYNAPCGILATMLEGVSVSDPRIVPVSLRSLLWTR